ncbi:MAG TPA: hypothetical protein VHU19_02820 [Pyrinomonadaceae bacterium]|jgi:hypothetical protein|nr:hypothetical protein [Pyrinomonadaceae bacterium]
MTRPIRILLQSTIPATEDDWHIGRFSLLGEHLSGLRDAEGRVLCEVAARDRVTDANGDDEVLRRLDSTDFDELWLFAVDAGDGLTVADCQGITRFRQRGGGILSTRDHQDLGSSLCTLGGVGRAHFFHSKHQDPDETRRARDDQETQDISWPNYHSGSNGDYQEVAPAEPLHELMLNPSSPSGRIEYFPAHPHEGGVGVPEGESRARVVATGMSQVTQRPFNLVVAFEREQDEHGHQLGRAVAESSFHHFVDYNWDTSMGCPSFLAEPPGDQLRREPEKLEDVKAYVRNLVLWLAPFNSKK